MMAAEFPSRQQPSVRGGRVVSQRIYVDRDGNPVSADWTGDKWLYAAAGATLSESEAKRFGITTSEDPEPAEEPVEPAAEQFVCACGYEAKTNAGLSAHQRACEDSG